jgi:DNA-binding NarL/FixJ family response regulator
MTDGTGATMTIPLTLKQQRICDLITRGFSNKEIAFKIGIGHRTVESHRDAIFKKTGVRNAVELTRKVLGA